MADWIKLPDSGFLNLDRYPKLGEKEIIDLKLTQNDKDYLLDQLGLRAMYRASRIRGNPGYRPPYNLGLSRRKSAPHTSKARIR